MRKVSRREFVRAAAASATTLSAFTRAVAAARLNPSRSEATFDLVIKGGRVIDPASRLDAIRDVAISGGRIAAVNAGITADAADTIDARGKLVVPGLLDIHTHVARSAEGPARVLKDGVTGWIDAGSQGADHVADTIAVARSSPH